MIREIHKQRVEEFRKRIEAKDKDAGLKYGLAVEELRRRKDELIKALSEKIKIIGPEYELHYVVLLPENLGSAHIEIGWTGSYLKIWNIQVGPRTAKNSALRHLGIWRLLIEKIIEFAKEKGLEEIILYYAADTYDFYRALGFNQYNNSNYFTMNI